MQLMRNVDISDVAATPPDEGQVFETGDRLSEFALLLHWRFVHVPLSRMRVRETSDPILRTHLRRKQLLGCQLPMANTLLVRISQEQIERRAVGLDAVRPEIVTPDLARLA